MRLDRELGLRRAEAAERAVGRRVRHRRPAADAHVVAAIGSGGVDHPARQHHRAERAVRAGVHHHVDVHRGEPAVASDAGALADDRRVALGRGQQILGPVVDHLHRRARPSAPGSPRDTPASTGTPPCRRSRRRSRSARRAPARAAAPARRSARGARSTGTAATRRPSYQDAGTGAGPAARAMAPRSSRWSRCRAVPGGRCDTRPRPRRPRPTSRASRSPLSMAMSLKLTRRGHRVVDRCLGAYSIFTSATADASASRSAWARSTTGSATWRTSDSARHGWSSVMRATTFAPGTSRKSALTRPRRRGTCRAVIRPRGIVDRTVAPNSRPGTRRSST